MPEIYHHRLFVQPTDIDPLGHANNVVYVEWMQQAAIAHSAAQGWNLERYKAEQWSWVVRAHRIEYRRPALLDDEVIVRTWVADLKKFASKRRFEIYRQSDQTLLARAETDWVFVNFITGKLMAIPAEVAAAFVVLGDLEPKESSSG